MIPKKAQEILDFWFKETPAEKRFKKNECRSQKSYKKSQNTRKREFKIIQEIR